MNNMQTSQTIWLKWGSHLLTLGLASVVLFWLVEVLPGDPALVMLGMEAEPETLAALRQEWRLSEPVINRYWQWITGMLHGDFGRSYTYSVPVVELIQQRLQLSLPLALYSLVLTLGLAIPVGTFAALHQNRFSGFLAMLGLQLGLAIPNFWLALLLIFWLAIFWPIFPAGGFEGWAVGFWAGISTLSLPALALALPQAAILGRLVRAAVLENLQQPFFITALSKGLTKQQALWRHALPNALLPLLTLVGLQFSFLLASAIIIENVFNLPGVGQLLLQAVRMRDLIVVKNLVFLLVVSVIVVNACASALHQWLDPRLRQPVDY